MQILWTLITLFSIQNAKELPETADPYIVECNRTMACAGDLVTDCTEADAACIIDCSSGDEICKDAEFMCHPNHDCTLICDSLNANKACLGTVLNASQSSDISVNVLCRNSRACEYMIIDANSSDLYLNITVIDTLNAAHEQYIAKHSEIYLPSSGTAYIHCIGHSSCHSMRIHGNSSTDSTLHLIAHGQHAFKDSYLSFSNDSDIDITCDSTNIDDNIGECCIGAVFDGRLSGIDSDIDINCIGNNACYDTVIFANALSKSLSIGGLNGDNVLSAADIYCPSSTDNGAVDAIHNCNINVGGNTSTMLSDTKIHTLNGFDDVFIQCDYTTSIQHNCYANDESGPTLYCDTSCSLILDPINNEWQCVDDQVILCNSETFPDISSTVNDEDDDNENDLDDMLSTTMAAVFDNNINRENNVGLMHNRKGQIVLSTIIFILIGLCIAVWIVKKESIKEWMVNPFEVQLNAEHSVMRIPNYNANSVGIVNTKNKYASLEESCSPNDDEDTEFIASDPTDDEFDDD